MRNRGIELFMLPGITEPSPQPSKPSANALPQPKSAALPHPIVTVAEVESGAAADTEAAAAAAAVAAELGPSEWPSAELQWALAADSVPGWQAPACLAAAHLYVVQQAAKAYR